MTGAAIFLALWAILRIAHDTPFGRLLHRVMVDLPIAILARFTRERVLVAMILLGLGGLLTWFGGADGFQMLGMALPDVTAWLTTVEIGAYLDAIAVALAAASIVRLNFTRIRLVSAFRPLIRSSAGRRRSRCSHLRPPTLPANDDEEGGPTWSVEPLSSQQAVKRSA